MFFQNKRVRAAWVRLLALSFLVQGWLHQEMIELPRNQDSQGPCQLHALYSLTSLRNSESSVYITDEPYLPPVLLRGNTE